jgi:hypothetical protein
LKIRLTEKVTATSPRREMGGRLAVLLLDKEALGIAVYDRFGQAPSGQVAVLTDNHVMFVDAEQVDCDEALVFLDRKAAAPDENRVGP